MRYPFNNCPKCFELVEFYNDDFDKNGGRYRCPNCGRDSTWKMGEVKSLGDVLKDLMERVKRSNNEC